MKKTINALLALLIFSATWISCNDKKPEIKIAYVRGDLITKYKGYEEAVEKYKKHIETLDKSYQSLAQVYQEEMTKFNQEAQRLPQNEAQKKYDRLKKMEENLMSIQEQAKKTESELTQGALNQINTYVEKYGKDNGYTIILSTLTAGTILYADSIYDITDTLLYGLNKEYAGGGAINDSTTSK